MNYCSTILIRIILQICLILILSSIFFFNKVISLETYIKNSSFVILLQDVELSRKKKLLISQLVNVRQVFINRLVT